MLLHSHTEALQLSVSTDMVLVVQTVTIQQSACASQPQ